MPSGTVQIELVIRRNPAGMKTDVLDAKLADLGPWLTAAKGIAREAIQDEFLRGVWRSPTGEVPWEPHVEYPEYVSHPLMIWTGKTIAAWMGTGPGRIDRRDEKSFTIGVSGHPGLLVHRGGTNARNAKAGVTLIFVTQKMRWFLGLVLGMWLKKTTQFIRIPARPHATPDMRTREEMRDALKTYLVGATAQFAGAAVAGRAAA